MAEYAYGNARVRARKSALLGSSDYEALMGLDLDGLLGALAGTAYRSDIEAALARFHGVRRLHEAVRSNLGRSLRELRGFYSGTAGELVELLLSSWDVRNLITLLRGQAAGAAVEDVLPLIVPVGRLDEASAREVARQPEFAAAVDLLLAWRLPTPEDARVLGDAWLEYERSADLAALERAVVSAHAARVLAGLQPFAGGAKPLVVALREEDQDTSLLNALRLRAAALVSTGQVDRGVPSIRSRGSAHVAPAAEEGAKVFLSGSSASHEVVASAFFGLSRGEVAATVLALPGTDRWRRSLEQWAKTGDLVTLQDDFEKARVRSRVRLFVSGDPLGIDIPLAYVSAKEAEARNLRVLGQGAVEETDIQVLRTRLLLP